MAARLGGVHVSVPSAQELGCRLLDGSSERVRHSAAVAKQAASLAGAVDDHDANLLVAAAWVHDIGYSPMARDTGFHPLDGARFLRAEGWDPALCALVAHHSGSRFLAPFVGCDEGLAEFTYVEGPVSDALTISDQVIGPNGRRFSLDDRMHDRLERHGPDSPNARAHLQREAYFRAALQRVEGRLSPR